MAVVLRYRDHGPADARRDAPQRLAEKREPDAMQNTGGPGLSTFATNQVGAWRTKTKYDAWRNRDGDLEPTYR
jgi:hypothetical protein